MEYEDDDHSLEADAGRALNEMSELDALEDSLNLDVKRTSGPRRKATPSLAE